MKKIKLMKKSKINKNISRTVVAIITATVFAILIGVVSINALAEKEKEKVDILFTHDVHSYIASYETFKDEKIQKIGGFARLKTLIDEKKANNDKLLILDGGDLSIGTLYQTLVTTDALELRLLGKLGFDATTLGNHDFDYGMEGFIKMFEVAAASGDPLPAFPICNIDWSVSDEITNRTKETLEKCNLCDYKIINKGDVKIAVIGVFGKEALDDSPTCELTILDQAKSVQKTIDTIKAVEGGADMYVLISHSGTSDELKKSEDEQLAIQVPDLDVIVSAHSHTVIDTPRVHGDTYVVSCGCYTEYAGFCSLSRKDNGRWEMESYDLIPLDESISENQEIKELVDSYNKDIDEKYLSGFGYTKEQALAENDIIFEPIDDMYFVYKEHKLGNLMSDAYRYAALKVDDGDADVAVVPAGTIRGTFYPGTITVSDAFQAYSLGIGKDEVPGYPLVKFYLTGEEVKTIAEIDASLSRLMPSATLYCSGISYSVNNNRMILNKSYDVVCNPNVMEDSRQAIDNSSFYAVVTDLYTAKMLGSIPKISYGIINVEPKYKDGSIIPSDEKDILWDTVTLYNEDGTELKTWTAIAGYIDSFEDNHIPLYYDEMHGRKDISDQKGIAVVFNQTNKYFWGIVGVAAGLIGLIVLFSIIVIKLITKNKKQKDKC